MFNNIDSSNSWLQGLIILVCALVLLLVRLFLWDDVIKKDSSESSFVLNL